MTRIPNDYKWKSQNNSDLFGHISASKNVNLDEEGYIKLSSRMALIYSEDSSAQFGRPLAIGRTDEDDFEIVTDDEPFSGTISPTSISFAEEAGANNPSTTGDSDGVWWKNKWFVSENTDIKYKSGSTWTDVAVSGLTSGKAHPLEVFRNKNSLAVGNGPEVKLFTESAASLTNTFTATLPEDYEVIGLAYSNNKLGIITKLSDTTAGQNQDAFFFVWDGGSGTSGLSGYPIGSDMAAGIIAYKGTFVVITRTGQLLVFNGGGFSELGSFPFYFKNVVWGDFTNRVGKGKNIVVEGDVIYMNLNLRMDQYGKRLESHLPYCPSGIWCYDPKVGLYHRYSPSMSPMSIISVLQAGVNTTTNILTVNTGTVPPTGSPVKYTDDQGNTIGGLTEREMYYIIKVTSSTFKLATSKTNAESGIAVDVTSQGGSQHSFMTLEIIDFGASLMSDAAGIALTGATSLAYDHIISGHRLDDYDSASTSLSVLCVSVDEFENRGYIRTAKILAKNIEDGYQSLVVPFSKLVTVEDKIIVKVKTKDVAGLPITTEQGGLDCNWTSQNEFYTTADIACVKTAFDAGDEIDVEILYGAGAGTLSKMEDIDYDASTKTYAVVLSEEIPGASSGRFCGVQFDNFKEIKTVDVNSSENEKGYVECAIGQDSKWCIFKIELRGFQVRLEPLTLVSASKK